MLLGRVGARLIASLQPLMPARPANAAEDERPHGFVTWGTAASAGSGLGWVSLVSARVHVCGVPTLGLVQVLSAPTLKSCGIMHESKVDAFASCEAKHTCCARHVLCSLQARVLCVRPVPSKELDLQMARCSAFLLPRPASHPTTCSDPASSLHKSSQVGVISSAFAAHALSAATAVYTRHLMLELQRGGPVLPHSIADACALQKVRGV